MPYKFSDWDIALSKFLDALEKDHRVRADVTYTHPDGSFNSYLNTNPFSAFPELALFFEHFNVTEMSFHLGPTEHQSGTTKVKLTNITVKGGD
ncbi:MAG: hypothetical protein GWN00_21650 [Aliifodinibius sp.]|nr:hypothetical protein [Fodinibius sp.]NIY27312.1 hypothetical protein [Fodinibius sp.]